MLDEFTCFYKYTSKIVDQAYIGRQFLNKYLQHIYIVKAITTSRHRVF